MKKAFPLLLFSVAILAFCGGEIFAHLHRDTVHSSTIADELNLLGALSGFVGAILAGAGIIITLVAIYSWWNVEERVKSQSAEQAQQIQAQIIKRTNRYFRGFDYRLKSLNTGDVQKADGLMRYALEHYPDLAEARSEFASRLFNEVRMRFAIRNKLTSQDEPDIGAYRNWLFKRETYGPSDEVLRQMAGDWLSQALQHKDNPMGLMSLYSAEINGIWQRTELMFNHLQNTVNKISCDSISYVDMALLLHSCNDVQQIQEVGKLLKMPVLLSEGEVFSFAGSYNENRYRITRGEFLAKVKQEAYDDQLQTDLYRIIVQPHGTGWQIAWDILSRQSVLWPERDEAASTNDIWAFIQKRFWVIMPCIGGIVPEYSPTLAEDV